MSKKLFYILSIGALAFVLASPASNAQPSEKQRNMLERMGFTVESDDPTSSVPPPPSDESGREADPSKPHETNPVVND
jgi:hypothetical protein